MLLCGGVLIYSRTNIHIIIQADLPRSKMPWCNLENIFAHNKVFLEKRSNGVVVET
jgi:hypothetical protein